jgi:hypothetical protein
MSELPLQQVVGMLQAHADTTNSVVMAELYDYGAPKFEAGGIVKADNYAVVHFFQGATPHELAEVVRARGVSLNNHDLVLNTASSRSFFVFARKDIRDAVYAACQ